MRVGFKHLKLVCVGGFGLLISTYDPTVFADTRSEPTGTCETSRKLCAIALEDDPCKYTGADESEECSYCIHRCRLWRIECGVGDEEMLPYFDCGGPEEGSFRRFSDTIDGDDQLNY